MPLPANGEILVRNLYCSLDPAMRRWMDSDSYAGAMALNQPIRCVTVGCVIESSNDQYRPGDYVIAMATMEYYSVVNAGAIIARVQPDESTSVYKFLNLFGLIGLTAYFGLLDVGHPKPGETVLVSAAAGAVGSIVGQIAKIQGCRAVGIAGTERKCQQLLDDYGFDAAINYRAKDLNALVTSIKNACPDGVDIYFDNVGGMVLDAALACINPFARLIECGMVSQYNVDNGGYRLANIWQIVAQTATMRGFLGRHYFERLAEATADLKCWAAEGKIRTHEHIESGLENFYPAFMRLSDGSNTGKLILKL